MAHWTDDNNNHCHMVNKRKLNVKNSRHYNMDAIYLSIIVFLWFIFGNSPTFEQAILVFALTLLFL